MNEHTNSGTPVYDVPLYLVAMVLYPRLYHTSPISVWICCMENRGFPPPPREELGHVRSLIIDAPAPSFFNDTHGRLSQEQDAYNSEYRTLVEEVGNPDRNGVVVSAYGFNPYRHRNLDCLLSAWADAVGGGEGCWTTAWVSE